MFEKALIRGAGIDGVVDIGLVAETLLFYRSTHLLLDMGSLPALATQLGIDGLLMLLRRPEVTASYCPETPTVLTNTKNGLSQHDFGQMFWHGKDAKSDARDQIALSITRSGELNVPNKLITQVVDLLKIHRLPQDFGSVGNSARADCDDAHYVNLAARTVLETLRPTFSIPRGMRFGVLKLDEEFAIDTNLDFAAINRLPGSFEISGAYILAHIVSARADTYFAADYMGELVTGPANSKLIRLKHFDFIRRRFKSEEQHDIFENVVLDDARTVREVVNSKERSIAEFFRLLDEASKFRTWMQAQNPDSQLVREYYDQMNKDTWIGRLPGKTLRFAFFTGAGILADMIAPTGLGTAAGIGLGATDSLLLDKLMKGWRPSHFIEGPLKKFVEK
jgi:hypothetical protein